VKKEGVTARRGCDGTHWLQREKEKHQNMRLIRQPTKKGSDKKRTWVLLTKRMEERDSV